jgi:hypothetical protein
MATEPAEITERISRLEQALGRRVVLRGVRVPDPLFRGRVSERKGVVVLEYRDAEVGYFWHYDIIEELLLLAGQGKLNVVLYEGDDGCTGYFAEP